VQQTNPEVQTKKLNSGSHTEPDSVSIIGLLEVLIKHKRLIVSVTLFAALVSIIYTLTLTNIYKATARIIPPHQESGGGLAALVGQAGALAGMAGLTGVGGPTDLYLGILGSRSVADAVIKRLDLAKEFKNQKPDVVRNILKGKVKFRAGQKDGIITIEAFDKRPERSAQLANVFVEELGKATVRLNLNKASTERNFLEKRLEVVKHDLSKAEDDLKEFSQKNKTIQVDSQARASIEAVAKLKAELALKEVQLASLRSRMTDESSDVRNVLAAVMRLRKEIGVSSGNESSADAIPTVGAVPSLGVMYTRLLRQVKVQEAIYEQLSKQYEFAKLTEAKDSANIQVIDDAVIPDIKDHPKRALIVFITSLGAFFASVLLSFLLEYYQKLSTEDRSRVVRILYALIPRKK
jgi:uncharacterized protein involved in exopolysaccharide biosynthesis